MDRKRFNSNNQEEQVVTRVRLPRGEEVIGIIEQRLGGNKMLVNCLDGKTRNCRVPGRFSRKFWLREGNFVIVQPWPDDDDKADVVHQYRPNEIIQLKKKNLINNLKSGF